MSAMLIANSPPLLKQAVHKTPPKASPKFSVKATPTPVSKQQKALVEPKKVELKEVEPKGMESKLEPKLDTKIGMKSEDLELGGVIANMEQLHSKPSKKVHTSPAKITKVTSGEEEEGEEEADEEKGGKKGSSASNKFVNIPSIEYPVS